MASYSDPIDYSDDVGYESLVSDAANAYGVPDSVLTSVLNSPNDAASQFQFSGLDPVTAIYNVASNLGNLITANNGDITAAINQYTGNTNDSSLIAALTGNTPAATSIALGGAPTTPATTTASGPSFWSDPLGYFKSAFTTAGASLGFGAIAVVLIVFGLYAIIRKQGI